MANLTYRKLLDALNGLEVMCPSLLDSKIEINIYDWDTGEIKAFDIENFEYSTGGSKEFFILKGTKY